MTAKIIDGKVIADEIRAEIGKGVEKLVGGGGPRPGLATVSGWRESGLAHLCQDEAQSLRGSGHRLVST